MGGGGNRGEWSERRGDFYLGHFKAHLLNEARYKARFIKWARAREAWRPVPPQREQVINELTRYAPGLAYFHLFSGGIMQIPFNVFFSTASFLRPSFGQLKILPFRGNIRRLYNYRGNDLSWDGKRRRRRRKKSRILLRVRSFGGVEWNLASILLITIYACASE